MSNIPFTLREAICYEEENNLDDHHNIQYKCGYCGWVFASSCEIYTDHPCLEHYREGEDTLYADENNALTIVSKDEESLSNNVSQSQSCDNVTYGNCDEAIITLVQQRKALYDYRIPLKERIQAKKNSLWKEIGNSLRMSEEEVKARWKYLKDCYNRCRKKMTAYKRSGSAGEPQGEPPFRFYNLMSFLGDIGTTPTKTVSSVIRIPVQTATRNTNTSQNSSSSLVIEQPVPVPSLKQTKSTLISTPTLEKVTPSTSSQTINNKRKKTSSTSDPLDKAIIDCLSTPPPEKPSGLQGFLLRVEEGLNRLPYRKRQRLEIKFLQLLAEAESDEM